MVPQPNMATTSMSGRTTERPLAGWLLPLLVALSAGLFACTGEVPTVSTDDPQLVQGREVYVSNCVGCHGADGSGRTGSKLNDGAVIAAYPDPADVFDVIADGKGRMPAFGGKLSAEEVEAVVRFTREGL